MNETGARDIFEHLGVWNSEAVHSLNAFAKRDEYFCIPKDVMYLDYNGPAAEVRRKWTMDQVWAEYETAHDQFRSIVETMPEGNWGIEMVYPWNKQGTITRLIILMMEHEKTDHCELVVRAIK